MAADPRPRSHSVASSDSDNTLNTCVVCFVGAKGFALYPCGHDHFCEDCAKKFRTCPLCRAPIVPRLDANVPPVLEQEQVQAQGSERRAEGDVRVSVLSRREWGIALWVIFGYWVFIFIAGWIEWAHDTKPDADSGCIDNTPGVRVGAALTPYLYYALIVLTQLGGVTVELLLIRRMKRRRLMPRKEFLVLCAALGIELLRMLFVNVYMLPPYFFGGDYHVFRIGGPPAGDEAAAVQPPLAPLNSSQHLPTAAPPLTPDLYYIATHRGAFTNDTAVCTTFDRNSPLLDYGKFTYADIFWGNVGWFQELTAMPQDNAPWDMESPASVWEEGETACLWASCCNGRFSRIGWIIGGEFALYYLFAAFINEFADCMFVVPTTTKLGWTCKVFAVALEVFQLCALCPAATFTHNACLHFTAPLGVPLSVVRGIIVQFGYIIWGLFLSILPLGAITMTLFFAIPMGCVELVLFAARFCCAQRAEQWREAARACYARCWAATKPKGGDCCCVVMLWFAFFPILFVGMFLGILVIAGQASKQGPMEVLTAIFLLADVLFKVGATLVTEAFDYALHLRVRRALNARGAATQRKEAGWGKELRVPLRSEAAHV